MNTASRSLRTRTPQCWLMSCGKPEAVRRDLQTRTGSRPRKTCEPARKFTNSDGRGSYQSMSLEITSRAVEGIQIVGLKGQLTIGQEDLDFRAELDKLEA